MTKLKKGLFTVFATVFLLAVALTCVTVYSQSGKFAYAENILEISSDNSSTYLDIDEQTKTLNGFKDGVNLPSEIDIIIPEGVEIVADSAFDGCWQILSVTLPESLKEIQTNAFLNCTSLVEIYNKSEVINLSDLSATSTAYGNIAYYALNVYTAEGGSTRRITDSGLIFYEANFAGTSGTYLVGNIGDSSEVTLPAYNNAAYSIYQYAFWKTDITSVVCADSTKIAEIGNYAFFECTNLTSVQLPDTVTKIGYSAFSGCSSLLSVSIPEKLVSIGDYAFNGCTALASEITVPKTLETIGVGAFYNCRALTDLVFEKGGSVNLTISRNAFRGCGSLTVVELPDRLAEMYLYSFYDCANLNTVYMPSNVTFKALTVLGDEDNVYFGTNTLIVFNDYTAYNNACNADFIKNHISQMTYLVQVSFNCGDGNTVNYERLANRAYNFIRTAANTWAVAENQSNLFPVQEGYSSSVWYSNSAFTDKVDVNAMTELLSKVVAYKQNSISVYAKYIEKPVLTARPLTYDGNSYGAADYQVLVDGEIDTSLITIKINGKADGLVCDANDYTLSLQITDAEKYGAWNTPVTVIVTVSRQYIDLSMEASSWEVVGGGLLGDSNLNVYRNDDGDMLYYYIPPTTVEEGYSFYTILPVINSAVWFNNKEISVKLVDDNRFSTSYEHLSLDGADQGEGMITAIREGSYTAKVRLDADSNYQFSSSSASSEARGVTYTISKDGTAAIITKVWYIVNLGNRLVFADTNDNYEIAGWTYNSGSENPEAPVLENGYDQSSKIEFTLRKDGTDIADSISILLFNDYVNISMPSGVYELSFLVPVTEDIQSGSVYSGFTAKYSFTVGKASFDSDWKEDAKQKLSDITYKYNGEMQMYSRNSVKLAVWEEDFLKTFNPVRQGIWAQDGYAGYYSEGFEITFNLYRMLSNTYYTYEQLEDSRTLFSPVDPDTYTLYYQLAANNYESMVDIMDDVARREYRFTITIYRELEIPEIATYTYTGSDIIPTVEASELYTVAFTDSDYVNAGSHYVTFIIADPEHYRWEANDGVFENGKCNVYFVIERAFNYEDVSLSLTQWTWGNYSEETNVPVWSTYFEDEEDSSFYAFVITSKSDGKIYSMADFGTAPVGSYTLTAYAKGYLEEDKSTVGYNWHAFTVSEDFAIGKSINTWAITPNVMQWSYGSYDKTVNLILGQPRIAGGDNVVTFTISYDAAGEKPVEGLESFTSTVDGIVSDEVSKLLAKLGKGSYYLWSSVAETDEYSPLKADQAFAFNITQATNFWDEAPAITTWIIGQYDSTTNVITANSHFGDKVDIVIISVDDDKTVVYDSAKGINNLKGAKVGVYQLTASVQGTDDYSDLTYSVIFRVFEKAGLEWWVILIIIVGVLIVLGVIFLVLHEKGVLQMITGKVLIAMQTKATVDATIAAIRANKVAAEAKISVAKAEAEEAEEERRKAIAEAKARPIDVQAAELDGKAQSAVERAEEIKQRAETIQQKAAMLKEESDTSDASPKDEQ